MGGKAAATESRSNPINFGTAIGTPSITPGGGTHCVNQANGICTVPFPLNHRSDKPIAQTTTVH